MGLPKTSSAENWLITWFLTLHNKTLKLPPLPPTVFLCGDSYIDNMSSKCIIIRVFALERFKARTLIIQVSYNLIHPRHSLLLLALHITFRSYFLPSPNFLFNDKSDFFHLFIF